MQKVLLLFMLLIFSLLAKSQDSAKVELISINKHTMYIEELMLKTNSSIKAGNTKEMRQHAKDIRAALDSIETEMQYLPADYYENLSPVADMYKTAIDDLQKVAAQSESGSNFKLVNQALETLKQQQSEMRKVLKSAYSKATQEQAGKENKQANEMAQQSTKQPLQPSGFNEDTVTKNSAAASADENATALSASTSSDNAALLNTIYENERQIEGLIDSIHLAMKKNSFTKVSVYAKNISNASLKISDLILLLNTNKKESLLILVTGLKNLAESLHELAHNGIKSHHEIHETIDKIVIKFNSVSTGINLVK